MKLTIDEVLARVENDTIASAPPPPTYQRAWLRAQFIRRQRAATRRYWIQNLVATVVALSVFATLLVLGDDLGALRSVGSLGAALDGGLAAMGSGVPFAVLLALAIVALGTLDSWLMLDDGR